MMISQAMNNKLNEQITAEFAAAHKYLQMSCAFDDMGFKILAERFRQQHDEERKHAEKILDYVLEVGGSVSLESIAQPTGDFSSVERIVEAALEGEKHVTKLINDLMSLAVQEKDFATRSFLDWFVDEQVEEVSSMSDLLNLVRISKGNFLQVEVRVRHQMSGEKS